jgi:hypothetical protein
MMNLMAEESAGGDENDGMMNQLLPKNLLLVVEGVYTHAMIPWKIQTTQCRRKMTMLKQHLSQKEAAASVP